MSKAGPGAGSLNKIQALVDELSETRVVDIVEIPLGYIAEPAAQIRVKAAGPLGSR